MHFFETLLALGKYCWHGVYYVIETNDLLTITISSYSGINRYQEMSNIIIIIITASEDMQYRLPQQNYQKTVALIVIPFYTNNFKARWVES